MWSVLCPDNTARGQVVLGRKSPLLTPELSLGLPLTSCTTDAPHSDSEEWKEGKLLLCDRSWTWRERERWSRVEESS